MNIEIKDQDIIDNLDSVPGYSWWHGVDFEAQGGKTCWELLFANEINQVVVIEYDEDQDKEFDHTVNLETVRKGIQVMAEKFPRALGRIMGESSDGNDADLLLQCIVFGEEKYA